jgi:hypothetical protein
MELDNDWQPWISLCSTVVYIYFSRATVCIFTDRVLELNIDSLAYFMATGYGHLSCFVRVTEIKS